jgi:hypothetical protein
VCIHVNVLRAQYSQCDDSRGPLLPVIVLDKYITIKLTPTFRL